MAVIRAWISTAVVLVVIVGISPWVALAASADNCNQPLPQATEFLTVAGSPFVAIPSHDGCWVFVAEDSPTTASARGVVVFERASGAMHATRTVQLPINPFSMALSHDGHVLVVTAGPGVVFLDVDRLESKDAPAILGTIAETKQAGAIEVALTPDDRYVFTSFEGSQTIGVIDLARARRETFTPAAIVGYIPVGGAPVGLAMSDDGAHLFAVSEGPPPAAGWPPACHPERMGGQGPLVGAQGALYTIGVAKATTDPAHSIIATTPAGCNPVRVTPSIDGKFLYVTARGDNSVLVFDAKKLLSADTTGARLHQVEVGTSPVGMAFTDHGRRLVVANSNRFQGPGGSPQSLAVIDTARLSDGAASVIGAIPAGLFPRELQVSADGSTLFVANFQSQALEVVDLKSVKLGPPMPPEASRPSTAAPESTTPPLMTPQSQAAPAPAQSTSTGVRDAAAADLAAAAEDTANAEIASGYISDLSQAGDIGKSRLAASLASATADTAAAKAETAAAAVESDAAEATKASAAGDTAAMNKARDKAASDLSALMAADAELAKTATDLAAASAANSAFFAANGGAAVASINDIGAQDSSAAASLLSAVMKGTTDGYAAIAANEATAVKAANTIANTIPIPGRAVPFQVAAKAEADAQAAATAAASGGSASAAAAALTRAANAGAAADASGNPYAQAVELGAAAVAQAAADTIAARQSVERIKTLK